jgi:hypothetical protein
VESQAAARFARRNDPERGANYHFF